MLSKHELMQKIQLPLCRVQAKLPFIILQEVRVRVDSHIYNSYEVPMYYDSMIAKVITFGRHREYACKNGKCTA